MKVVAVTPRYPPWSLVGAWLSTHQCLRHLVARGHQVTAACSAGRMAPYDFEGVHVVSRLRGRSYIGSLVAEADVVISHANDSEMAVEFATQHNRPHVRMAHGAGHRVDGADLLVFCSEALRAATPHRAPSIVVHPPTVFDEYTSRRRNADRVTIVNCSKDKGILTAWQVADMMPDRQFLGVRGHTGHQIEPRTRARNFEVIETTPDMRSVYARTRILLAPSAFETWGRVGVEAMCSGIPVIAHPTPGLRESLGDAGLFVDRDHPAAWAEVIRMLDDPGAYAAASKRAFGRALALDPADDLDRFADAVEAVACREVHA